MRLSRADHVRCCRRPDLPASRLSGGSRVLMSVVIPPVLYEGSNWICLGAIRVFSEGAVSCAAGIPSPTPFP
jgi:hypothetical protein